MQLGKKGWIGATPVGGRPPDLFYYHYPRPWLLRPFRYRVICRLPQATGLVQVSPTQRAAPQRSEGGSK